MLWDENIVYFFNREKNPVLFQSEVCLLNFHLQITMISSQNNYEYIEQKDMYKFIMSFSSRWIVFEKNILNKLGFNIQ